MRKTTLLIVIVVCLFLNLALMGTEKQALEPGTVSFEVFQSSEAIQLESEELAVLKKMGDETGTRRIESRLSGLIEHSPVITPDRHDYRWIQTNEDEEIIVTSESLRWDDDGMIDNGADNQKAISMARRENGDIYVAYEDYSYSEVKIHIKYSTDDGETWEPGWTVGSSSYDAFFPDIAIGNGNQNTIVVSYYTSTGAAKVYVKNFDSGNYVFNTLEGGVGNDNIRPQVALDTDNLYYIYVCWVEEDLFQDDIWYSRSTDYGASFSEPTFILDGIKQNVDIGWGNGNLYIAYQDDDIPGKIKLIKSNSAYGTPSLGWASPILISGSTNDYMYPRIAVSDIDDKAVVFYTYAYSPSDYDIYYARTSDGSTWVTNQSLESSTTMEWLADIYAMPFAAAGDNFHVAFYEAGSIRYRNSDTGSSWSSATTIADASNASNDDFVAVCADDENQAMVAWVGGSSSDWDIYFDTDAACDLPSTPTGVSASTDECGQITILWNTSGSASSYYIYRDGAYLAEDGSPPYIDGTDGSHSYYVKAINDCGESGSSSEDIGIALSAPDSPSVVAASNDECGQITISYSEMDGASSYYIYRDGEYLAEDGTSPYVDYIFGEHTYHFRSVNQCGESDNSISDNGSGLQSPDTPTGLVASDTGCDQIVVEWNAAAGAEQYQVFKDNALVATISATQFPDATSGSHTYHVKAENTCGTSGNSNSDTGVSGSAPGAPVNVTASVNECEGITLTWDLVEGATNYQLFRDGSYINDVTTPSFSDIVSGSHSYYVKAENDCGLSSASSAVEGLGVTPIVINSIAANLISIDGYEYTFIADASWMAGHELTYAWDFGDNSGSSTEATPTYRYSQDEQFTVTLVMSYASVFGTDCDGGGSTPLTVVDVDLVNIPEQYELQDAFPNPFNPTTTIRYGIPEQSEISLDIYDSSGRRIKGLVRESKAAGWYQVRWEGTNEAGNQVSTGMYFARITTGDYSKTIKMIYLK